MRTARIGTIALLYATAMAQSPAPSASPVPRRPVPPLRPAARALNGNKQTAPQVVTIIHRLNGLKMFRLLLRSEQMQAIAGLDAAFNLTDDVHTNVIAGLALDDGETIAAWLPDADVEFGSPLIPFPQVAPARLPPFPPAAPMPALPFETPDVTVFGPDGKQLFARYIGFDASTGLSILRLEEKNLFPAASSKDAPVDVGQNVLLFGPEPVAKGQPTLSNSLYVRIGSIEGRVENILPAPSGEVARFKVSAARLSQANVGGIAVNETGETIGIVDGLEGGDATILPAASIRRAARRVLDQQASVPRPWLGVKGEAVSTLNLTQIQNQGWAFERATDLAHKQRGILLTSILPGSPAALAALRAGDVILKVDGKDIQNAADFTWWLEQAGPSSSVRFTVARPDRPTEEPLNVKLSAQLDPVQTFKFRNRVRTGRSLILLDEGLETIALGPIVAAQLRTTAGLLVVYVEPATPAFAAGLKPGDVIQTINGQTAAAFDRTQTPALPMKLEVVRQKKKLIITVKK